MTYIISTDKGFKLLKELPKEPDYRITEYEFKKKGMWEEYQRDIAQAINDAPFIKNEEVAKSILLDQYSVAHNYSISPYQIDLSGYDVSEPEQIQVSLSIVGGENTPHFKTFVTLTPKAVENKRDGLIVAVRELIKAVAKYKVGPNKDVLFHAESKCFAKVLDTIESIEKSSATDNSAQVESQANAFEDLRKLLWQAENARPEELHGRIEYIKSQFSVARKGEAKQEYYE